MAKTKKPFSKPSLSLFVDVRKGLGFAKRSSNANEGGGAEHNDSSQATVEDITGAHNLADVRYLLGQERPVKVTLIKHHILPMKF